MSKFLCYSFLVLLSLTIWRSPVVSAWAPSRTMTTTTLHHHSAADSSDVESNDIDHSRRRFLVQNTMRAATALLTTAAIPANAATPKTDVATDDKNIQNQSSSSRDTDPPKWPESESPLPSPWTNMSTPSFSEDDSSNGGAAEGATTDFSRAMQKAGKQKNIDPRTHG
jgi:hypothetical protein